jgi:hypothetical protein
MLFQTLFVAGRWVIEARGEESWGRLGEEGRGRVSDGAIDGGACSDGDDAMVFSTIELVGEGSFRLGDVEHVVHKDLPHFCFDGRQAVVKAGWTWGFVWRFPV